jgi:peptidoglycan/LPS O-acetylase OafA/YrhL
MTSEPDTRVRASLPRGSRRFDLSVDTPAALIRPELQALRAVSVAVVVVFHAFPGRMQGGYVGVDVFFVLSGFLIIGHLLRELQATGRVRVIPFWARRARRLIPASLVALTVTVIATLIWVPPVNWIRYLHEAGAAAVYVLNLVLAGDSVDYLAADNAASPVQHFWSLSIEEQLYIVWPLVILLVIAIVRRADAALRVRVVVVVLVVLTAASAIYSIWETQQSQPSAYFLTGTRAWEFGVGGILAAFSSQLGRIPRHLASALSWAGLLLIGAAALRYSSETAFPGFAAWLPVAGALLVIAAGLPATVWSPSFLFRLRPVQWLGDISYSLYLWHWPLLVIAPFALHRDLGFIDRVLLVLAAVLIAWGSKVAIEDPIRRSPGLLRRGPWVTVIATVVATTVFFAATFAFAAVQQQQIDQQRSALAAATADLDSLPAAETDGGTINSELAGSCLGASAFGPGRDCADPFAVTALTAPIVAATDIGNGVLVADKCKQTLDDAAIVTCTFGETVNPTLRVALVGDSHAGHWLEALERYAVANDWKLTTYLKTWCQGLGVPDIAASWADTDQAVASCAGWGDQVLTMIAADPDIDVVLFVNYTAAYASHEEALPGRAVTAADFAAAWDRLQDAGKRVLVIRDTPNTGGASAPQCIAEHLAEYDPCATPRGSAFAPADPQWEAVASKDGVIGVDLTDRFCDATTCHSVIGGLIVYFDAHHLTATFARTMAPVLGDAIVRALSGSPSTGP